MIRIALCSEDSVCQEKIAQLIAECNQQGRTAEPLLADTYHSLQALVDNVEDGDLYDVFLLDMEHPDAREFGLAHRLRKKLGQAVVLVVTSCSGLAFTAESAQLKVSRYVDRRALDTALPEALSHAALEAETQQPYYLLVTYYHDVARVAYPDIQYVHRVDRATYIAAVGGTSLRDSRSLSQVFQALDDPRFQYIERGCFVNLDHVAGICGKEVCLKSGERLPASSVQLAKVREELLGLWGGEGKALFDEE